MSGVRAPGPTPTFMPSAGPISCSTTPPPVAPSGCRRLDRRLRVGQLRLRRRHRRVRRVRLLHSAGLYSNWRRRPPSPVAGRSSPSPAAFSASFTACLRLLPPPGYAVRPPPRPCPLRSAAVPLFLMARFQLALHDVAEDGLADVLDRLLLLRRFRFGPSFCLSSTSTPRYSVSPLPGRTRVAAHSAACSPPAAPAPPSSAYLCGVELDEHVAGLHARPPPSPHTRLTREGRPRRATPGGWTGCTPSGGEPTVPTTVKWPDTRGGDGGGRTARRRPPGAGSEAEFSRRAATRADGEQGDAEQPGDRPLQRVIGATSGGAAASERDGGRFGFHGQDPVV